MDIHAVSATVDRQTVEWSWVLFVFLVFVWDSKHSIFDTCWWRTLFWWW